MDKAILVAEVKLNAARGGIHKLQEKAAKLEQQYAKYQFGYKVLGLEGLNRL